MLLGSATVAVLLDELLLLGANKAEMKSQGGLDFMRSHLENQLPSFNNNEVLPTVIFLDRTQTYLYGTASGD